MSVQSLTIDNALHGIEELLRHRISPEIGDPFAAQMARLSCLLLRICANGVDGAAELRVNENAAIRAILAQAAGLVPPSQGAEWQAAAQSADPGLKLSALDAENNRLRQLLAAAHAAVEDIATPAARALDQHIWQFLEAAEASRAPGE